MTEQQHASESSENSGKAGQTQPDAPFEPIKSQDDLNRIIKDRLDRERAKFGDYADLKAKAARLDKIEEANKSENERLTDALEAAKKDAETARVDLLRYKIAAEYGITDEKKISLLLSGTDEATLKAQADLIATANADASKPRTPRPDPAQGRSTAGTVSTADQFAAAVGGVI